MVLMGPMGLMGANTAANWSSSFGDEWSVSTQNICHISTSCSHEKLSLQPAPFPPPLALNAFCVSVHCVCKCVRVLLLVCVQV